MKEIGGARDAEWLFDYKIYECGECFNPIFRCYTIVEIVDGMNKDWDTGDLFFQYPSFQLRLHKSIPSRISKLYNEGLICLNACSQNGAMICFRKCMEEICRYKGADPELHLWQQADSVFSDKLKDASSEIREWPVIGEHPHNIDEPSPEQVLRVKEFLDIIFMDEFELPAKIRTYKQHTSNA
jgi:hypothetical protein